MYIGQTLMAGSDVFSPWMGREADNAIFTYGIINSEGSPSFTVTVWHKNEEDTGEGDALSATFSELGTGTGIYSTTVTGLKELVRFEYDTGTSGGEVQYVVFQMLESTWYNKA